MAEAIGFSLLGKALGGIGKYLVDPISRQFGYLFCFNTNIQNLETQLDTLKLTREGVQLGVDETRNNVRTVGPHLEAWLTKANDNTAEAETIIKDKAQVQKGCFNGWCPNLKLTKANANTAEAETIITDKAQVQEGCFNGWWPNPKLRYSLGRKAVKKTQELALLHAEGSNYIQSSYNPPPPSIEPIPTTTEFQGFDSRILVMNEIIEALKDDGIHLVGICGMGGIGKTTMAKEVAKRTKNLFNEFPMAVVSQEPDLTKVQGCIADMLDFKEIKNRESLIARANLLRKRLLLDNKKILVILDDIWEEFDLEESGFPLEGGCKILFTSRNRNLWKGIQNKRYIQLQVLVGEEPWHLFREKVGDCADDLDLLPLAKQIVNECGGLPLALVTIGRALTNEHNQHHWNNALQQLRTPCSESLLSEVPAKVYQALSFSYNFLKDERAKKLFLLCCLFPEDHNISIEYMVRYGIGLRWFEGIDKVDEVRDRVNVLVDQLKSCYLLLDGRSDGKIKMHDAVRDVAVSIAAKDKHGFMTIHGAKSREWPKKVAYELNTSISVISNEIEEFPGGLRCSKLEFLLIRCRNSSLKIPSNFFEGMGELKVLEMKITEDIMLRPSSLQFLSNLLTLRLDCCQNFDNISIIGKLLNLEILTFRGPYIEEIPEEIGGLVNLKLLDVTGCSELKRIAPGVISSLVQLQEVYMGKYCTIIWEREGNEGGENASLREFESLSNLNTLEINITDVECLPRIPLFSQLTKYSICIGFDDFDEFFYAEHASFGNHLKLRSHQCTIPLECVNSLLRSSAVLELSWMDSEDAVQELFRVGVEGLQHLKDLTIVGCATPECFVNTMKWVPRTPNAIPHIFPILEKLELSFLPNLRKICHCQLPTGSFGKLKHLYIENCDRMEEVIWKEKGEDDATNKMEFPALESMTLWSLPMLIGFCRGINEIEFPQLKELHLLDLPRLQWPFFNSSNPFSESMENHNATFLSLFPHKVALPSLEELELEDLDNLEGLEHIPISVCSFSKLRKLHVKHCGKWLCVFPSQFLTRLGNLEDLTVENFNLLEKVFELEMVDCKEQESEMLSLLKSIKLKHLPQLDYISKSDPIGFTYISQLSILHVHDCDNLRYLFPNSMMKCMLQLQELDIRGCEMMSRIVADEKGQGKSSVDKIEFSQLKVLRLYDLPNLVSFFPKVIATSTTSTERLQNVMQTLFNEKVAFPSLEELELQGFQNMNEIWCNQLQTESFNKLIKLHAFDCGSLRNMFSPFMARHLVHLKRLVITSCSMMEEVVAKEEEGGINRTPLPKLEHLELKGLPKLKSFCHVIHDWELPLVEHITILKCPKLKTFSPGVICTPKLQCVFVKEKKDKRSPGREGEDWLWISDLNQTIPHLIDEVSSRFTQGYGSIHAREWYMELPDAVRHIVNEAGFGLFCAGLSRHPVSRTVLGALMERWWDTTNSFHFSAIGDMTMTPFDFSMLTGLDVGGWPIPYDAEHRVGRLNLSAWIYLLGARPPIDRASGRVRYTWFSERYRGTSPQTIEAVHQYARGFLMFLLGTTLFSERGNAVGLYLLSALVDLSRVRLFDWGGAALATLYCYMNATSCERGTIVGGYWRAWELWVYAYFPTLAPELEVEVPLQIPYSRRFEGRCRPRPRETLLHLRQFFDTVRTTEVNWLPWIGMPGNPRFLFAGAWGTSRYRIMLEGPVGRAWFLGERFMCQTMGNSNQDVPSLPPPEMRSAGDLTPRTKEDRMLGIDSVLFLEERNYATYRYTYLMPLLSGVRTSRRRAADMPSSSRAQARDIPSTSGAGSSRGGVGWMPSTCQCAGWPDLPTGLTGWEYGTPYQIPLEPPRPDHRYIRDPDSPPPSREYMDRLLRVVASLEGMVLWRETLLHFYSIPVALVPPGPSRPSRAARRGTSTRGRGGRGAPVSQDDEESSEEKESAHP